MIDKRFESGELINTESGEECNYSIQDLKSGEKAVRDIVDKEAAQIVNAIIVSQDEKEITNYLDKFNRNMSKKNLLRILKYNELLDKVGDEALNRIENHPDELTATELLNYMKVMQDSINTAKKETSPVLSFTGKVVSRSASQASPFYPGFASAFLRSARHPPGYHITG